MHVQSVIGSDHERDARTRRAVPTIALGQSLDADQTQQLLDGLVKAGWLRPTAIDTPIPGGCWGGLRRGASMRCLGRRSGGTESRQASSSDKYHYLAFYRMRHSARSVCSEVGAGASPGYRNAGRRCSSGGNLPRRDFFGPGFFGRKHRAASDAALRLLGSVTVDHLLVGVIGGFQPDKIARAFAGDEDGMYARFLYVWPLPPDYRPLTNVVSEVEPEFQSALIALVRLREMEL
jgi:hypothetical protein